jgi:hypothetical protein
MAAAAQMLLELVVLVAVAAHQQMELPTLAVAAAHGVAQGRQVLAVQALSLFVTQSRKVHHGF